MSDAVSETEKLAKNFKKVLFDVYKQHALYQKWVDNKPFVDPAVHIDYKIVDSVPSAGSLKAGEVRLGDGTGPNGRDELFWSVDGETVARVEADSIIS